MALAIVSFEGADELKRVLATMSQEARDKLVADVAMEGAQEVLPDAIARAPVLQHPDPRRVAGNLKSKITAFLLKVKPGEATAAVGLTRSAMRTGKFSAFYASWIEFGTQKLRAFPFLRPAFDARREAAERRMTDKVVRWLEGFGR